MHACVHALACAGMTRSTGLPPRGTWRISRWTGRTLLQHPYPARAACLVLLCAAQRGAAMKAVLPCAACSMHCACGQARHSRALRSSLAGRQALERRLLYMLYAAACRYVLYTDADVYFRRPLHLVDFGKHVCLHCTALHCAKGREGVKGFLWNGTNCTALAGCNCRPTGPGRHGAMARRRMAKHSTRRTPEALGLMWPQLPHLCGGWWCCGSAHHAHACTAPAPAPAPAGLPLTPSITMSYEFQNMFPYNAGIFLANLPTMRRNYRVSATPHRARRRVAQRWLASYARCIRPSTGEHRAAPIASWHAPTMAHSACGLTERCAIAAQHLTAYLQPVWEASAGPLFIEACPAPPCAAPRCRRSCA